MNVKDAATKLEVSAGTVYGLIAGGKLKCYRIGQGRGCIRLSDRHLEEYLAGAEPAARPVTVQAPVRQIKLRHLNLD